MLVFRADAETHAVPPADLPGLVSADENFVWVDLSSYTRGDLQAVAELLALHRVAVHTTQAAWTRPRLDVFDGQFYVAATIPDLDADSFRVQAHQLDLIAGRNFLVSAHKQPLPFMERVQARTEQSCDLVAHDAAYMLYILLDELLGYYERLHERMQEEGEALEERALADTSDAYLRDLLRFKRYAFAVSQLAEQHREIFAAFLRPDFDWVSGAEVDVYFRDLTARHARLTDALATVKEGVNNAFDIYVSNMSHRTNRVMKILTMVSTVLLPATLIVGFFGANNIEVVHTLVEPVGFVAMVASVLLVMGGVLAIYRRMGWL